MSKDILYLKSSIFYHSTAWPNFIINGFTPFIKKYPNASYFFAFSKEQGHNIRLAIAFNTREFETAAQHLHQHLNDFLKENPSSNTTSNSQSLFKDFPNNSVRYNLFEHVPFAIEFPDQELNLNKFFSDFWNLLTNIERTLLEQIISNRSAFTLQLFTMLLFCLSENEKQAKRISDYILNKFYTDDILLESANEVESSNLNVLTLFSDMWTALKTNEGNSNFLLPLFKKLNTITSSLKKDDQRSKILYHIVTKLHTDLGIRDKTMIADFYKKSMAFFSKNE